MYKFGLLFIIAMLFMVSCGDDEPETGKIFTVTVSEGTGSGTLYDAIRNANMETEPCKIVFDKVYSITLKEDLPEISCSVTIDGGKDGVTIDAEGKRRIFLISLYEIPPEVSLANLTLTGGYSDADGGAISYVSRYRVFPILSLNNCTFKNNKAKNGGGAIFSESPTYIDNCCFMNNESSWGGAIAGRYMDLHIKNSLFESNKASNAGAISLSSDSGAYISDCVFSNNEAAYNDDYGNNIGRGGAITAVNALYIFNSLFLKNRTNGRGGAITLFLGNQFICMNSTFVENSADGRGGAIYTGEDYIPRPTGAHSLFFAYCTFFGNKSGGMGGAIFGAGPCYFVNNIFTGNKVSDESTDYYHNILTGNQTTPETTSDFFAGYLHMAYNIYDKFYCDVNNKYSPDFYVTGNVQATAFDVFGTDQPQLKDNIIPVLPNGPADGLGRPTGIVLGIGYPYDSFSYKDNGKWWRLQDGSEYSRTPNDTLIVTDQTGFQRPENNITIGAWQIR